MRNRWRIIERERERGGESERGKMRENDRESGERERGKMRENDRGERERCYEKYVVYVV